MNKSPIIAPLLLLSTLFHCFTLSSCVYRVFIRRCELTSYFEGTQDYDTVKGHHVDIIRHGEEFVLPDGRLQLSTNNSDSTEGGSGMMPLFPMGNPLPTIPSDVGAVTISWHANEIVNYTLEVEASPEDHFRMFGRVNVSSSGTIPLEKSGFQLKFECHPASIGRGQLNVKLTTVLVSTGENLTANFYLEKICEGMTSSGSGLPLEPSVLDMTSSYTVDTTVSLHTTPSPEMTPPPVATRIRSSPMPSHLFSLSLPTSDSAAAVQTTFLPSSIIFTPSPSLSSSDLTSPSSSLLTTTAITSSTKEDILFMSLSSSLTPEVISSSIVSVVQTSSAVQQLLSSQSSSLTPTPSPSSSEVTTVLLPPTPSSSSSRTEQSTPAFSRTPSLSSSQLFEETTTTLVLSPTPSPSSSTATSTFPHSPSSTQHIDEATSSSIFSPAPSPSSSQVVEQTITTLLTSPGLSTSPITTMLVFTSASVFTTALFSQEASSTPPSSSSSTPLSTPVTSIASSPSTVVVPTPSSVDVSPSSSSSQPPVQLTSGELLPTPSSPVNETEVVEGVSRLAFMLIIVFAPVVGVLLFVICIMICCICCCAYKRRKQRPKRVFSDDPLDLPVRYSREVNENELEESFSKNAGPPLTLWMSFLWGTVSTLPAAVQSIIKHYTVDRRSLAILSTVAREDNGAVVKGQWSVNSVDPVGGNKGVMMKMLTGFEKQYGHRDEIVQFVEQATLLRGRDHPNIHKVLKVSVEDNYIPLVVYPIVEYGNMHQFLTFCRISPNESPLNPVTIQYKANFALQIASAMYFLNEEGIVHPDLALRNCLLDSGYNVKVSDGALSQLFFPECYSIHKGTVRPVRWAAIETLKHGQCTSASNVWSYGVTVWEILTLGEMPYSDIEVVPTSVMMGERLPQPPECPHSLYDVLSNCWQAEPMKRPTFDLLQSHIDAIGGRYTPVSVSGSGQSTPAPVKMIVGSRQSTPGTRHEAVQHTNTVPVQPQPQYVPVVAPDDDDEVFGVPQDRKNSAVSIASQRSRDSLQPEKLSITFSVLSGDMLEEGGASSGESEEEEEEEKDSELIEVLEPELLDRFMPSLRREQVSKGEGVGGISTEALSNKPVLTLTSPSVRGMVNLEDTSRYRQLPNAALSPGPLSTSTMTSRLSPSETSSQYGPSTVRSDDTPVPPLSSPSPDLTSKTSTIGDETLSTASNPLLAGTSYHMPGTGMLSKTSTLESVNTMVSASTDYNHPPNLIYTPHLNGSQYNGTEHRNNNSTSSLSNGHPPGPKVNGDVIKPSVQSPPPPLQDSVMTSLSNSATVVDSNKDATVNGGVLLREGVGDRQTSRDSQLSRTSFGLGLGDLSSDLMSAFDSFMT